MTIPHWTLLGFAVWTLVVLSGPVGVYRWSHILTGRKPINAFPADTPHGPDWYRRGMRAHLNCVENLPVYAAIVTVATFAGVEGRLFDALCIIVLAARICQSVVHMFFKETPRAVSVRFSFFLVQIACMVVMAGVTATA